MVVRQESEFKDAEDERPLIHDFLDPAQWFMFSTGGIGTFPG